VKVRVKVNVRVKVSGKVMVVRNGLKLVKMTVKYELSYGLR
jgi:hypothetical protein